MMTHSKMAQFPLAPFSPLGAAQARARVIFGVTLGCAGERISLVMEQEGTGKGHISIKEDTLVEIVLRGDQLFFSKKYPAITMKTDDVSHFYGGLEYALYDEKRDRYKSVQFVARFNKGGQYGTVHPFNINVDLLQDCGVAPEWIGLTIDPDIKNPPPQFD
jgi:hypothetical protein